MTLKNSNAFSGFSVNDLTKARTFYEKILGLEIEQDNDMKFELNLVGGSRVFVYAKKDHSPATFTVLNFSVTDIDKIVDELKSKGVKFEHYDVDVKTDKKDIMRGKSNGQGPDIAWCKDPSGNILSIIEY